MLVHLSCLLVLPLVQLIYDLKLFCFDGFYCFDELWHCRVHHECVHFHSSTHGYVLLVHEKDHVRDGIIILLY